jgi:hypothetical protein
MSLSSINIGPLETYMVINFRAREISQGTCKLIQTPTLIKNKIFLINIHINVLLKL